LDHFITNSYFRYQSVKRQKVRQSTRAVESYSHTKNSVSDFIQVKCNFTRKTAVLRFWDLLWET